MRTKVASSRKSCLTELHWCAAPFHGPCQSSLQSRWEGSLTPCSRLVAPAHTAQLSRCRVVLDTNYESVLLSPTQVLGFANALWEANTSLHLRRFQISFWAADRSMTGVSRETLVLFRALVAAGHRWPLVSSRGWGPVSLASQPWLQPTVHQCSGAAVQQRSTRSFEPQPHRVEIETQSLVYPRALPSLTTGRQLFCLIHSFVQPVSSLRRPAFLSFSLAQSLPAITTLLRRLNRQRRHRPRHQACRLQSLSRRYLMKRKQPWVYYCPSIEAGS